MSRVDRVVGLVRSLAIYHVLPRRQRPLRALVALGCRVVAVAATLRAVARSWPGVTVVEAAVSSTRGRATLAVSERHPTVSTLAAGADRLGAIGDYRFNWPLGESHVLAATEWLTREAFLDRLTSTALARHGDVYARRLD